MKDTVKGELIASTFKAVAVEMEGGAIGQVCAVNKIPFLVIRVMSDCADDGQAWIMLCSLMERLKNRWKLSKE